jgi:hypothetical protein
VKVLKYTHILDLIHRFITDNILDLGTSFSRVIHFFCEKLTFVCKFVINLIIENNVTNRVKWDEVSDLFFYEPGGTSTKNVMHWIQIYRTQVLAEYDYGKKQNLQIYGRETPPEYKVENWENWNIPTFMTMSDADPFSAIKDIQFFLDRVKNKNSIYIKHLFNYNHCDYVWSTDAKKDIFYDILNFLE